MKRLAASFTIVLLAAGCRAPMPTFDLLAPYGSPRVPPPSTGSYGTSSPYYQPPPRSAPTPAVGTGVRANSKSDGRWTLTDREEATNVATRWNPSRTVSSGQVASVDDTSEVQLASFQEATLPTRSPATSGVSDNGRRIRIVDGPSVAQIQKLNGMPVSDATGLAEPRPFAAPNDAVDISQLPRPTRSVLVGSSTTRSDNIQVVEGRNSANTTNSDGWQTRPNSLRVAGR